MSELIEGVDFALAAYREEGAWQVQELAHDLLGDIESLSHALRRFPGDGGAVGLVAMDEDFFILVRVAGPTTRVLLSDITAADEWELAGSAIEFLGLPMPEDEDDQVPAGDLDLLGDLGMHAMDMGVLLDDFDLYPDEMLSDIARRIGFGKLFDDAVGLTSRVIHDRWTGPMRAALDEARAALATGDVPIGAVVLAPDGTTIGRGRNVREADTDPTGHAEVVALRAAARERGEWRLEGCTLVVTLEPCTMCAGAAVLSRVERVVFGAFDPKAGAVGSLWDVVRDRRLNHRPEVESGVLAEESAALLEAFFAARR